MLKRDYTKCFLLSYYVSQAGKSGCFNTLCPGFVQVNTQVPLGIQYPASKIGGPVYEELMYLDRVNNIFHFLDVLYINLAS